MTDAQALALIRNLLHAEHPVVRAMAAAGASALPGAAETLRAELKALEVNDPDADVRLMAAIACAG